MIGGGNIVRGSQLVDDGHGPRDRRLHGHARHRDQRARRCRTCSRGRGIDTRVMTAIRMEELAEPYIRRRALRHFEKGRIVIFAAGTGQSVLFAPTPRPRCAPSRSRPTSSSRPRASTASTRPIRRRIPNAKLYETISYRDVMLEELDVMDQTAVTLCKENNAAADRAQHPRTGRDRRGGPRRARRDPRQIDR